MIPVQKIYVGGWFQRTTLHLSEIYDFFKDASSPLKFDQTKLKNLRASLEIQTVVMRMGKLDAVAVATNKNIHINIREDGLVVLNKEGSAGVADDIHAITAYYEQRLSPALNYIFSLGAPIPKELANIKTIYPYFVVLQQAPHEDIKNLLTQFQQEKYFEIRNEAFEIYRGNTLYVVNNIAETIANIEAFIEEQIFIREFKSQLHRYLNLHRIIWEHIAEVKERGEIRGSEVGALKNKIEGYQKTINLIEARINQMGAYIKTREAIAKTNNGLARFLDVLDFKHETLIDTLAYIKEIWSMTKNYVTSALDLFSSIQARSTESSVKNLTIVTSMGVGATIMGLFSQKPPQFTSFGFVYFIILAVIGYSTDKIMRAIYLRRMYKIRDAEIEKDIK